MQFRCLLAVGVLTAGGVVTAACSDDGDGEALPSTTASSAATTTSAPTTNTTLDFETEVKLAALELLELRNEVFMAPDVDRVSEYIADTCVCLERERQIVADLETQGRRWTTEVVVPLGIRLDRPDPNGPSFALIASQPPGTINGPAGDEMIPEVPLAPYFVTLARSSDGKWRLNALEGFPSMDRSVAERIIEEEGLP